MADDFEDFDTTPPLSDEAQEAIDQCERICDLCEDAPERHEEFASGVLETTESIWEWIEKNGRITPKQQEALNNMEEAIERCCE